MGETSGKHFDVDMLNVLPLVTYTEGKSGQIQHSGYIQYTSKRLHGITGVASHHQKHPYERRSGIKEKVMLKVVGWWYRIVASNLRSVFAKYQFIVEVAYRL